MHKYLFLLILATYPSFGYSQTSEYCEIRKILEGLVSTPPQSDSSLYKKALVADGILPSIYNSKADIELRIIINKRMGDSFAFSIRVYRESLASDKISFFDVTKDTDISKGWANYKTADVTTKMYYPYSQGGAYKLIYNKEKFRLPKEFDSWADIFRQLGASNLFSDIDGVELNRRLKEKYPGIFIHGFGYIEIDIKNGFKYRSVKYEMRDYEFLSGHNPSSSVLEGLRADLKNYNLFMKTIQKLTIYQK